MGMETGLTGPSSQQVKFQFSAGGPALPLVPVPLHLALQLKANLESTPPIHDWSVRHSLYHLPPTRSGDK